MAKKPKEPDEIEVIDENLEPEETPESKETPTSKKPINIMDSKDSAEPPKRKSKDDAPTIDLSLVIDQVKKGFASLDPKETPKPEPKLEEKGFMYILGEW